MPTYEYECPKCPRVFEVRQRITEPPLQTCDRCGGPIHRLLSAAPFILKGEGWYVTDYPSEARKKATKESTSDAKTSESKTSESTTSPATSAKTSKDGGSADSKSTSSESKSSTATSASSTTSGSGSAS